MQNGDGTYNLTGLTGSVRYMAPEVANSQPYNAACDVYSFSILFWQILSCQTPYEQYTPKALREKVYNGPQKRPLIDPSWKESVRVLLQNGWAADFHQRCSMSRVSEILRDEALACRSSDADFDHIQKRSNLVGRDQSKNFRRLSRGVSDITVTSN